MKTKELLKIATLAIPLLSGCTNNNETKGRCLAIDEIRFGISQSVSNKQLNNIINACEGNNSLQGWENILESVPVGDRQGIIITILDLPLNNREIARNYLVELGAFDLMDIKDAISESKNPLSDKKINELPIQLKEIAQKYLSLGHGAFFAFKQAISYAHGKSFSKLGGDVFDMYLEADYLPHAAYIQGNAMEQLTYNPGVLLLVEKYLLFGHNHVNASKFAFNEYVAQQYVDPYR